MGWDAFRGPDGMRAGGCGQGEGQREAPSGDCSGTLRDRQW